MSKFKVGDRVRLISFNGGTAAVGDIGQVSFVTGGGGCYEVQGFSQSSYMVEDEHIELVTQVSSGKPITTEQYLAFVNTTLDDLQALIKRKNADYTAGSGDPFANFRVAEDFGVDTFQGVMLRMSDKIQRLKSFCKNGKLEVANEGAEDSLKDIIGYSLICLGLLHEKNNKPG